MIPELKCLILHDKNVKNNPDLSMALFNKGRAYIDLNEPKKAKNCYEEALKYNPQNDGAKQGLILLP